MHRVALVLNRLVETKEEVNDQLPLGVQEVVGIVTFHRCDKLGQNIFEDLLLLGKIRVMGLGASILKRNEVTMFIKEFLELLSQLRFRSDFATLQNDTQLFELLLENIHPDEALRLIGSIERVDTVSPDYPPLYLDMAHSV